MSRERSYEGPAYDMAGATSSGEDDPVSVTPFPTLDPAALQGIPGKIIDAVAPHTEAHPAPMLVQFLSEFGTIVGNGPHVYADNREHPARINALIVGKTSTGAKGTSYGVVRALIAAAEVANPAGARRGPLHSLGGPGPIRRVSGLSSGEGLIEAVRDANGDDPNAKNFDEGVLDKRLQVVEQEFTNMLAVMERQGSTLPGTVRAAWDGDILRTLTRSPLTATGAHISIIGHATPGELRLRMKDAQVLGGTMNRFVPIATRRTKLLSAGGNIPREVVDEYAPIIAEALSEAGNRKAVERTPAADALWISAYPELRRDMPDGPVASILARAAPQVLRLSLVYALADCSDVVDEQHLTAALAIWRYAEATAHWMFGREIDNGEINALIAYVAAGGTNGRTRTQISSEHYKRNRSAADITAALGELMKDGRIRQEIDRSSGGRPTARYFAC